ncbi:NUDIX hydrolase [Streptomyces sp. NPDC050504]|uniref:NUDIX hydrolase n=1 Tax=Streptomyces sp. NPDC050504 TaxID=3365618 RepID=UPI00379A4C8A
MTDLARHLTALGIDPAEIHAITSSPARPQATTAPRHNDHQETTVTDQPPNSDQLAELRPLAAVIEHAIAETPVRLGTNDWGTVLAAQVLAEVAAYMGRTLGPDAGLLGEVQAERQRQNARWGEQNHPDGTGLPVYQHAVRRYREQTERAAATGFLAWRDVLLEEVYEALAETDPAALRTELVQVAAVCVAWAGAIDRRAAAEGAPA